MPWGTAMFFFAYELGLPLGLTCSPISWLPGILLPERKAGSGVKLTTLLPLAPRLKMSRSLNLLPLW